MWGGRAGEVPLVEGLSADPTPVNIQDHDILDFGIGLRHIIVLTMDRRVFIVGDGRNGQLGFDIDWIGDWQEVVPSIPQGAKIVGVGAAAKGSFLLVEIVRCS